MEIFVKVRAACAQGGLFAGKWALIAFAIVAAFALAVQALALVLAAVALLVIALCLATVCMPEESRAVWAWMRETLCRWSAVAGTAAAQDGGCTSPAGQAPAGQAQAGAQHSEENSGHGTAVDEGGQASAPRQGA